MTVWKCRCGKSLPPSKPRVFKHGRYLCPDCIYREEYPREHVLEMVRSRFRPQQEKLFD